MKHELSSDLYYHAHLGTKVTIRWELPEPFVRKGANNTQPRSETGLCSKWRGRLWGIFGGYIPVSEGLARGKGTLASSRAFPRSCFAPSQYHK